ncbi:serine/alanine racemase [Neobacillus niacini]|uniref:acyltransferase n=1 Tax=Neobacillus niacini TaxID=86668 RepID=UPI00285F1C74|nr:acyltransferase [Neobacillus niacini]MDR7079133.1 serine/alanine racemase [Neobacillus niacini]
MNSTTNNNAVDVMKFICAILVVIIHAPPLYSYNETANFILVEIIARIAVPYFFVCAGYFFFKKINMQNEKIEKNITNFNSVKKYIIHLLTIYAFWTVFFLLWWVPLWYKGGYLTFANMKGYVISIFISGSYFHLWYIVALIYGMVFTFLLLRFVQMKVVIATAVIFYLIGTFAYSYSWIFNDNILVENFIKIYDSLGSVSVGFFRTFPYLLMGIVFAKYRIKITLTLSAILSVICLILVGLEVLLLDTSGGSRFSYVLLTGFTVFFIFNTVSKINLNNSTLYPLLRKMSSIIYFVHPMFININGLIFSQYFSNKNSAILFCSVIVCVMLFSIGLIHLSQAKQFNKLKSVY